MAITPDKGYYEYIDTQGNIWRMAKESLKLEDEIIYEDIESTLSKIRHYLLLKPNKL